MLGSGGVVVLDDTVCMVEFALRTMKFYQHESCGWCIPCREGTDWLKKTLTRFHAGGGVAKDIDNIRYLAQNMLGRTFCPLGDAAAMPTIAFVDKFRKEFEDHLNGKPCPYAPCNRKRPCAGSMEQAHDKDREPMADVTFTVDGKKLTAPAGTLLIEACRKAGIAIPHSAITPASPCRRRAACAWCVWKRCPNCRPHAPRRSPKAWSSSPKSTRSSRRARPPSSCCSATIRSIARCAMPAASANCRT